MPRQARDDDWELRGACVDSDPELFFPKEKARAASAGAREVCAGCEVRAECLEDSVNRREPWGVWGGLTERERRKLLNRARG